MPNSSSPRSSSRPELLAPAGDWDALRAAVANGADAVYFGLSQFNARHRAANFTREELPELMDFLRRHNVRGYVAFNTLIFSDELGDAAAFLRDIAAAGVDAVIVQDLGLVRLIKRLCPALPVHGSTQMTLTEPRGIEFVKRLGVERVILARELSVADIQKITPATDMPLEVFVHGALCVAYSGQCLTSEALGGRSANRGQCAQACRMPYELIVDDQRRDLGDVAYLLSPLDLAGYEQVRPLADAGVVSVKIEGRLKGAPYVAQVTQTYRAAIDAAAIGRDFDPSAEQLRDLNQVYSRGFAPGFLAGLDHQRLVAGRFPKSRGVRLGSVSGSNLRGIRVRLDDNAPVKPGDGIVFDEGRPQDKEAGGRVYDVIELDARTIELRFDRDALDPSRVAIGAIAWKTDDPALRQRLEATFATDRVFHRVPVTAEVRGRVGEALTVAFIQGEHRAEASWPGPLELARKQPLTVETLREQLGRLGDTPFVLADVTLEAPDPVMAPRSVLNDLRRRVAMELMEKRRPRYAFHLTSGLPGEAHTHLAPGLPGETHTHLAPGLPGETPNTPRAPTIPLQSSSSDDFPRQAGGYMHVLVRTMEQLDAVLTMKPASVYCEFEDIRRYRDAVSRARVAGVPIGLASMRVIKPGEEGFLHTIGDFAPDAVLIRNLAGLEVFREQYPNVRRIGDFSLNVANELTAELFLKEGLERLVPSYDLNWDQFAALAAKTDAGQLEAVVHQHMPMFHNEHCIFAATLSNGKDHRDCGRPCDRHRVDLRDRTGAAFPLLADAGCRNTVYNAVPQSAAEYLPRMLALGIRHFRIELLRESPAEAIAMIERYRAALHGDTAGRDLWRSLRALNQLGVTRGTLRLA